MISTRKTDQRARRPDGRLMPTAPLLFLLLAGMAVPAVHAAPLYKWVDSAGQVTYSSTPPPAGTAAESVQAPLPPSAEEVRQAEEQAQRTEQQAGELEAQRREREAREAEEARLRALQSPPPPTVIEQPVYVPQPVYYPPVVPRPPKRHPGRPPQATPH